MSKLPMINKNDLFNFITSFEKSYPGYWWSVSIRNDKEGDGGVVIRGGPSISCPDEPSRRLLATKLGDGGFWVFSDNVSKFIGLLTTIRNDSVDRLTRLDVLLATPIPQELDPVSSGNPALTVCAYIELVRIINDLDDDFIIDEVYFGSCHTSRDSSVRGRVRTSKDDYEYFDISNDLSGPEGDLNCSIRASIRELIELDESYD